MVRQSGRLANFSCPTVAAPTNGLLTNWTSKEPRPSNISVHAEPGMNYVLKAEDADTHSPIVMFFVNGGSSPAFDERGDVRVSLPATLANITSHDVERVLADIDADHGDRGIGCLRHGVLLVCGAPCQLRSLAGQEHGRTIPLTDLRACVELQA
jgi:hypothetical protein